MKPILLGILTITIALAQDAATERLKREVDHLKASSNPNRKSASDDLARLQSALLDWIELRLPVNEPANQARFAALEQDLNRGLADVLGETPAAYGTDLRPGYATTEVRWFPELSDAVFLIAHATVGCGYDDAVYMYSIRGERWTRIVGDHAKRDWGWRDARIHISDADPNRRRLLLVDYASTQCASTWRARHYSVYRLEAAADSAVRLISDDHQFWFGNYDGVLVVLKPDELITEFLDRSVDDGIHNRTNIQRLSFSNGSIRRLDPVAFQPQDFVEEWLTRPWSEMQSRSRPGLQPWHEKFQTDFSAGEYQNVVPCVAKPAQWLIELAFTQIGDKEFTNPESVFFLVRDLGNYHYSMESVSTESPEGCPGDGPPSDKHPWLSEHELKQLH
jgi:hypothetical protein